MKLSSFIRGMIVGSALTMSALMVTHRISEENENEKATQLTQPKRAPTTTNFDIRFKGRTYILHTRMPKDSVELLMGHPYEISYNATGNTMHETWGYKNGYDQYGLPRILTISFTNNLLTSISQH